MTKAAIHITNLFYLIFMILISSCVHEIYLSEEPGEEKEEPMDKVRIEIFTRANPYNLPTTRAAESEVGMTPWVLVFKGNGENATFVEAVQAFELVGKRYVILTKQPAGTKYQLLILANPLNNRFCYGDAGTLYEFTKDILSDKLTNPNIETLSDACKKLLTEPLASPSFTVPFSGTNQTIPMSYLLEVDKIDNTTKIENNDKSSLLLVRTLAKMIIVNKAANFEFKGVMAVVNAPRQGRLHKLGNSIMGNTSNLTEYQYDINYSAPLVTAETVAAGEQSTENNPIYLYESDTQNNTYIIIKGTYENKDYYYKMAIVNTALESMDILRNRAYTFTIIAAKGPGYDTMGDAKVAKPSNIDLDFKILVDDSDSYEIMANNDYYLGVSNSVFIAYYTGTVEKGYEAFKLTTDCKTDFPNSRTISTNREELDGSFNLAYPADGIIPIVDGGITPRITPVGVYVTEWLMWYEDTQYTSGGVQRNNAYVTLKLGNLEKKIHIRQRRAIPAAGLTLKYMPTADTDPTGYEMKYYCLSAYVEDGSDDPKNWIKLRPSTGVHREDTDNITVDDGTILIEVLPNTGSAPRSGIIYLTTIKDPNSNPSGSSMQRIKININQLVSVSSN